MGELFFRKNALYGGQTFFGQIYGGMFYIGTTDQVMQGGNLTVKTFQRSRRVSYPLIDPDLSY